MREERTIALGRSEVLDWHRILGASAVQTLWVLLAFVGFGVGWAQLESRGLAARAAYPPTMPEHPNPADLPPAGDAPAIWLVDGFNVLHASLLGGRDRDEWWTGARRDEVLALARALDEPGLEVWVVFDGPRPTQEEIADATGVRQVFAPSADEWLLQRVRSSADPARIAVVTADRRVASKARHRGALVVSPRDFLARCLGGSDPGERHT